MLQPIIHGFLLALGLILPLGAQNVFVFNQGANQKKIISALPVIITAGLCDTFLIVLAILGVSLILMSLTYFTVNNLYHWPYISTIYGLVTVEGKAE